MRRLWYGILTACGVVNVFATGIMAIFVYSDHQTFVAPAFMILMGSALGGIIGNMRKDVKRKMPPRWYKPPKPRRERQPPKERKPVPAAPQKPVERSFAPIPMAEALDLQPAQASSSMPERMRRFVVKGDQAIHQEATTPKPPSRPVRPEKAAPAPPPLPGRPPGAG